MANPHARDARVEDCSVSMLDTVECVGQAKEASIRKGVPSTLLADRQPRLYSITCANISARLSLSLPVPHSQSRVLNTWAWIKWQTVTYVLIIGIVFLSPSLPYKFVSAGLPLLRNCLFFLLEDHRLYARTTFFCSAVYPFTSSSFTGGSLLPS